MKLVWLIALLSTAVFAPVLGQGVVLNEIQIANQSSILDENADSPDWIELFNPGPAAVDLNG